MKTVCGPAVLCQCPTLLPGLEGLTELCKELLVWSGPEVVLTKAFVAARLSRREKNLHVLRACSKFNIIDFKPVDGAVAFMQHDFIMNELELKLMSELPMGDHVFFPFEPADGTPGAQVELSAADCQQGCVSASVCVCRCSCARSNHHCMAPWVICVRRMST